MSNLKTKMLDRLKSKHVAYSFERNTEDDSAIIDVSLASELADSVPYLINQIERLEKENSLLYGRLNNIVALAQEEIKAPN